MLSVRCPYCSAELSADPADALQSVAGCQHLLYASLRVTTTYEDNRRPDSDWNGWHNANINRDKLDDYLCDWTCGGNGLHEPLTPDAPHQWAEASCQPGIDPEADDGRLLPGVTAELTALYAPNIAMMIYAMERAATGTPLTYSVKRVRGAVIIDGPNQFQLCRDVERELGPALFGERYSPGLLADNITDVDKAVAAGQRAAPTKHAEWVQALVAEYNANLAIFKQHMGQR